MHDRPRPSADPGRRGGPNSRSRAARERAPREAGRVGVGVAPGHFGELIQGRLGPDGPVALVTLPAPGVAARARFSLARPGEGDALESEDPLALAAARSALAALDRSGLGGRLELDCLVERGAGLGSSTAIALASLRACAAALGRRFDAGEEAALCLALEGAVDPTMAPDPASLLWASRRAEPLERAPAPAPTLLAVGGLSGPPVATDPSDHAFADVRDLVSEWRRACAGGDAARLAAAATASARRNLARAPKPHWDAAETLAQDLGALGLACAHTGAALALLFAPDAPAAASRARRRLVALGLRDVRSFRVGG